MWTSTLAAILLLLLAIYLGSTWERAHTPSLNSPKALAELSTVLLNDQLHFATFRGLLPNETGAPVLLILHGGPGSSDIPYLHHTDDLLEERFLVVHYDQRSAGKSCRFEPNATGALTIQQHVDDAVAMTQYLLKRFKKDKIYLLGGSWGSIMALLLAKQHSEMFHHVAVRGLLVDGMQNEMLSRSFVLEKLPSADLPSPPYDDRVEELVYQRQLLNRAGGMLHACSYSYCSKYAMHLSLAFQLLSSSETSWGDLRRFRSCLMSSLRRMWPQVQHFNAYESASQLDVPLLVLHGRHDHCTAMELVEDYVSKLNAPSKKLVWFERSAHSPQREESQLFQQTIIETFLGGTA